MLKEPKKKTLLFSVTIKDCRVDTFTVPGHGGSGKDTSNTGVRVTHLNSGAVGRAVDTRSQSRNKQLAFKRMSESKEFKAWHKLECSKRMGQQISIEEKLDRSLVPQNLKVELQNERGQFVKAN